MSIAQNYPTIVPSLSLDFSNVKALDPRVTFARASGAVYYGTETAKAEENLLQYSQEFDDAYWLKQNGNLTADATTAPDGTTTADLFVPSATSSNSHRILRSQVFSTTVGHVVSIFVQPSGYTKFGFDNGSDVAGYASFDLSASGSVIDSGAKATGSVQALSGGWFRVIIVSTATSLRPDFFPLDDSYVSGRPSSYTYTGDGTSGVFLWGAQLEQRSAVTAYTPTTDQPITRFQPVLESEPAGVARFDHNPVTSESLGLLVEEQRTNLLLRSEEFDKAGWVKQNTVIEPNTVIAPDGTLTVDKVFENTTTNTHLVNQSFSAVSGVSYTASCFVKKAERRYLAFWFATLNAGVVIDLDLGTISEITGFNTLSGSSIIPVGNGFYRVSISITSSMTTATAGVFVYILNSNSFDNRIYLGDGYSGIYIWGAQLEEGAFPTSYIKTVASQVTRAADSASMVGANFSEWYRQDEGSLYVSYQNSEGVKTNGELAKCITNTNNYMSFRAAGETTGTRFLSRTNGTIDVSVTLTEPTTFGTASAMFAYKSNDFAVVNNSGQITTDTSALVPVVDALIIGRGVGSASQDIHCNTTIKKLSYYPARLTNEQLVALTS